MKYISFQFLICSFISLFISGCVSNYSMSAGSDVLGEIKYPRKGCEYSFGFIANVQDYINFRLPGGLRDIEETVASVSFLNTTRSAVTVCLPVDIKYISDMSHRIVIAEGQSSVIFNGPLRSFKVFCGVGVNDAMRFPVAGMLNITFSKIGSHGVISIERVRQRDVL